MDPAMKTFDALIQSCPADWDAYIQHKFVRDLADGSLAMESFQHYLKQDYLFLIHFSRAWGLAVYKGRNIFEIRSALAALKMIIDVELQLHIDYCKGWGISEEDLLTAPESRANIAYTRYVLDVGNQGDLIDMRVALAPCLVGYGVIARWLLSRPETRLEGNPYRSWIDMYAGNEFQQATEQEIAWLNEKLADIGDSHFQRLKTVFREASRLEAEFWQMGLDRSL
jgi:thiaminase/transcriptional activator TenA